MYFIDKEKARNVLLSENFEAYQINILLQNFPPLPDQLGEIIEQWFNDQEIPDLVINGISLQEVIDKRHTHFLVAIRDLSRMIDPSLTEEKREQWRKILTTTLFYE